MPADASTRPGAVLEQAPNQVRQQVLVTTYRRVNTARSRELVGVDDLGIKLFAHAVQTLEFIIASRACVVQDAGQRVRIVRCELRINSFT